LVAGQFRKSFNIATRIKLCCRAPVRVIMIAGATVEEWFRTMLEQIALLAMLMP
jgi:hypothetical protein